MSKKALGLISALSANVIWAFMSIPLRLIKTHHADQILYYRIITCFVICLIYTFAFNSNDFRKDINNIKQLDSKNLRFTLILILLSGVFITLNWFTFIYVVNNINVKSAAFAYMVCPLITALGAYFILKEHLSTIKFTGIGIAIISIILLSNASVTDTLWAVLTAFFYAFFLIIQRKIQGINKINMLFFQLIIALIIIIPLLIIFPQPFPIDPIFWFSIVIIAIVFTILPLLLSLFALESLPSATVGILIYINPVVSFSIAFFYFDESVKLYQVFAYLLLIFAVLLFNSKILLQGFNKIRNYNLNKKTATLE
ncbi:permease [Pedobacter psychrophilus]|uniref:Permease n=1 Tax=Pedobacter psychrophilus TaxID=1826909 RepID=A0A179DHB5_9SPHI|nr:EamA family transporter [Pedobacter psychrophilus]OAQ40467.1 permease [Pedobacter psychrophilus]